MNFNRSQRGAWICLLFSFQLQSQITEIKVNEDEMHPVSKVAQSVKDIRKSGALFQDIKALQFSKHQEFASRNKMSDKMSVLETNPSVLRTVVKEAPQLVSLSIPKNDRESVRLLLIKVNPFAEGFNVFTSSQDKIPFDYLPGVYYRGVVEGNENNSVASISIFENEVIGSFTYENGNMVIQPSYSKSGEMIFFNDKDINEGNHFNCFSDQLEEIQKPIQPRGFSSVDNCVRVYIECDYALFQNKGGTANTVNWITSVFNNLATLYANESINTTISEIFVWTTADSYSKTSSIEALNQFKNARPSFNGDIAHLAALGGSNLGGVAWLDVLCSSYKYAYSNISSTYQNVPVFSWTVEVMTHEMGHNLGSSHTQWCGWNGGALDNCYTTEGGCAAGPAPTNGGTIMSYCHLTSYGINFNNGFGPQPGNKIRTEVAASSCLSPGCGGGGGSCNTPSGLNISGITQTTATGSWSSVSGATSYTFEYKTNSGSTWTAVSTGTTSYNITGLTGNTQYNARIKAICSSGSSAYSTTINFTTGSGTSCGMPVNLSAAAITQSTATISWAAVSGANSYNFQYKLNSASTWSQINVTTTGVNMSGMNPATSYSVRVQSVCGTSQSDFTSAVSFTTSSGYCISKSQSTAYEWIKRVNLGTIDRTSASDAGYFNGTSLVANLIKGNSYTLNYQAGSTGSSGTLYWKVWIDFNNNNSFDDANENIITNASSSTVLQSATFLVPEGASTANVRMRVSMKYGGYPTSCMTFSYGEVEDYTINIQSPGGDPCAIPTDLAISNIHQTTATANWNSVVSAGSYQFEYKKNSESNWNTNNATTTTFNLTGLSPNTLYNTRVKSICASGSSEYSPVVNLTTEIEVCNQPTNLSFTGITKTSSNANWTSASGATGYTFEYKLKSELNWTVQTTSATNFNLSSLILNSIYQARVKSNCTSGSSDYSPVVEFTTLNESCEVPSNLAVSNIEQTSAKANWTQVSGAGSYNFEYKLNSASTWTVVNTTSPFYHLIGLVENSLYDIRVKTSCTSGSSDYSVILHFTTTAGATCGTPTNLLASNITQNSAKLSWNSVSGATSYNVLYKLSSAATWSTLKTTSNFINLTTLTPASAYNMKVQALCGVLESPFTEILSLNTLSSHCVSNGKNPNYEWIKRVNLGTIDRISGKDGGYFNATNLSADVVKGSTYTINYQFGTTGSSGTLYWRVWIDYNGNNSFEDAGEMILSVASANTGLLSSTFTVPATASIANVRMRVSMKYGGYATSCMVYSYGEVEDYTVNIKGSAGLLNLESDVQRIDKVKIYPNPFTNLFNLEFFANTEQDLEFTLMDQFGTIFLSKSLHAQQGKNVYHIESSEFIPATYLMQIKSASDTYIKKIIKLE